MDISRRAPSRGDPQIGDAVKPLKAGFHLLVWKDRSVRVFGDVRDGEEHGYNHIPELNGKWSLWMALRVWWRFRQ
jgi:hypothetical protein